ncbi:MAG: TRAP transporter small permease subunit, partial [Acetobacteraceae bacterium]|nr:TRAP transporter small permease subunit [Acetobacteraceae bacterium]
MRRGGHPRITLVVGRLPLDLRRIVEAVAFGAVAGLLEVLVRYGWAAATQASDISMTSLAASQVWAYAVVPLASALMLLFGLRNFLAEGAGPVQGAAVLATFALLWWVGGLEPAGAGIYAYLVAALIVTLL